MASTEALGARVFLAQSRVFEVVKKHAPKQAEKLTLVTDTGKPPAFNNAAESAAWQAEALAALAEVVDRIAPEPPKRGRPGKS
jgi:hypothetical protein